MVHEIDGIFAHLSHQQAVNQPWHRGDQFLQHQLVWNVKTMDKLFEKQIQTNSKTLAGKSGK